ncbi:Uncharacterized protein OS=Bradyrhizobium sp. STM 3843 GN=BRAS3843_680012 PE=4 SV=1: DUF3987 [Gemmata massiliana]|uniref:DUF3987 domain-containing protein n=1 Tax=Gemmata massiliana TaxID=1210884 RepID=A0A6P2CYK5_9BACT|nr:DUF3987 domain-containing protein [Gemmata massiliana]VTR94208.1 Uncharacterized protein OS=Bradyrhizobium sp. STM 3843 GN=BRAS3843_680012 PE=4 SV=1: DUF3987 [Gemmata massiliana]
MTGPLKHKIEEKTRHPRPELKVVPSPHEEATTLGPCAPWPILDRAAALHGPAGELVKAIEPHTEADPVGILFQTLVGFGSIVGRTAHFPVEADRHYGNEFLVLVGDTADGRKGTSWGHARRALALADSDWASSRIARGLSSGEGLIQEVRDPMRGDDGVRDKRLLVMEAEFANVLKQSERQGNTLSGQLRQAWEGGELRTLSKASPLRCAEPHISLIGHITSDELHRCLTASDATNGLGNRHLFVCVKRSKELPEGGNPDIGMLDACGREIGYAAAAARDVGKLERDEHARALWRSSYSALTAARPGLVGALAARAAPHVCRLSLLYALLDRAGEVQECHLRAALACWDYCEASLLHIFGHSLSDPLADQLRDVLRDTPTGLSRTEIRDMFGRNKTRGELDRALATLIRWKIAEPRHVATGGRPAERWFLCEA